MTTASEIQVVISSSLECWVCFEAFRDPRILTCGHTYCLKCLQQLTDKCEDKSKLIIVCPYCQKETPVADGGVHSLPKNFALVNVTESSALSVCAFHDDGDEHGEVEYFCKDCLDPLCANCYSGHRKTRQSQKHTIKTLSDFLKEGNQAFGNLFNTSLCSEHAREELKFYCMTCNNFGCNTCYMMKHQNREQHQLSELPAADEHFKSEISTLLTPLNEIKIILEKNVTQVSESCERLESEYDNLMTNALQQNLNDLEALVRTEYENLLERINTHKETVLQLVQNQRESEKKKLKIILEEKERNLQNTQQKIDDLKAGLHLSVFEKSLLLKRMSLRPTLSEELSQLNISENNISKYTLVDITKWKTEIDAWIQPIIDAMSNASRAMPKPQLWDGSLVSSSTVQGQRRQLVAHRNHNIIVDQVAKSKNGVSSISALKNQLLIGSRGCNELHVYTTQRHFVTSISLKEHQLYDAAWTPQNNVVITTENTLKVLTLSLEHETIVVAETKLAVPRFISVSPDNIMYIADMENGIYQSADDGMTWTLLFKPPDGVRCRHTVKVSINQHTDDFWTLEQFKVLSIAKYRLRIYTMDKRRSMGYHLTYRYVTLPASVRIDDNSKLAYDGRSDIFLVDKSNKTVLVMPARGQHSEDHVRLLTSGHFPNNIPCSVAVHSSEDGDGDTLYVGQCREGVVSAFTLASRD